MFLQSNADAKAILGTQDHIRTTHTESHLGVCIDAYGDYIGQEKD